MAILLISETETRELLGALQVGEWGVEFCLFGDAFKSIAALEYVDLILIDCGMNVKKGIGLLREIKAKYPPIPVIILTDVSSEEMATEAFRRGAKDYFKKPVNIFQLRETLNILIDIRKVRTRERRVHVLLNNPEVYAPLENVTTVLPSNLLRAISCMEDWVARDLTLDEISEKAGMSKHHFCRVFKKYMGMSPMNFFTLIRIEKAKELLKNANSTVSMVAMEVGFNELGSFNKQFKKFTGLTPSSYKKKLQKESLNLSLF